jgi:hypothetical protein
MNVSVLVDMADLPHWPRSLRCGSAVARRGHVYLLSVVAFSGKRLYNGLVTRPQESYRVWCV